MKVKQSKENREKKAVGENESKRVTNEINDEGKKTQRR